MKPEPKMAPLDKMSQGWASRWPRLAPGRAPPTVRGVGELRPTAPAYFVGVEKEKIPSSDLYFDPTPQESYRLEANNYVQTNIFLCAVSDQGALCSPANPWLFGVAPSLSNRPSSALSETDSIWSAHSLLWPSPEGVPLAVVICVSLTKALSDPHSLPRCTYRMSLLFKKKCAVFTSKVVFSFSPQI